jgi:hypothetical protein
MEPGPITVLTSMLTEALNRQLISPTGRFAMEHFGRNAEIWRSQAAQQTIAE